MKSSIQFCGAILVSILIGCSEQPGPLPEETPEAPAPNPSATLAESGNNMLTAEEKADGWVLLFNGKDLSSWRNFKADGISDRWQIDGDAFALTAKGGGSIITKEQYGAFELVLDFKISPAGNSGVMYHVTETEDKPWQTGPEIQIQDHSVGKDPQKAGWLYQLYQAEEDSAKPAGEWNTMRLLISPEKCVHTLNGVEYFEYVKGSDDWNERVAASKFSKYPNFGKPTVGHICLQDHGNVVHFRNVKIKSLD